MYITQLETEQQIILQAFGYLTPSKCNHLGKTVFSFFGLSKDTLQNESQLSTTHKTERKSTKKPDLDILNMVLQYTLLILWL